MTGLGGCKFAVFQGGERQFKVNEQISEDIMFSIIEASITLIMCHDVDRAAEAPPNSGYTVVGPDLDSYEDAAWPEGAFVAPTALKLHETAGGDICKDLNAWVATNLQVFNQKAQRAEQTLTENKNSDGSQRAYAAGPTKVEYKFRSSWSLANPSPMVWVRCQQEGYVCSSSSISEFFKVSSRFFHSFLQPFFNV